MLSFLQDQNPEELPAEQKKSAATGTKAPTGGADKSQESEFLTVASHGKQVRKTTKLLAVIFVICSFHNKRIVFYKRYRSFDLYFYT